jgi:hypothetical protein
VLKHCAASRKRWLSALPNVGTYKYDVKFSGFTRSSIYIYMYIYDFRAAITQLNGILWDRDVTLKTKTHIYYEIVKSTITYAAETWCLKAKTTAKLNSTQMDLWRRSAGISRKDKIRNNVIKKKMNVTRSLLDDIKTKLNFNGTDSPKDGGGETAKRGTGMATIREKETMLTQIYLGEGD